MEEMVRKITGMLFALVIVFCMTAALADSLPQLPSNAYAVWLKNPGVERIRPQCGPGYQYPKFASMSGSTRLYKPKDITYLSARFCVGDFVYVEFGYTDGVLRFGFFEKSLFNTSDWNRIPSYTLSYEKSGSVVAGVTPYNGPGYNCGSYSSCSLSTGARVYACMESNGWYFCRFYNNHSNNYGDVYLWVPGNYISWSGGGSGGGSSSRTLYLKSDAERVNIRTGPGLSYADIGTIYYGETATWLGESSTDSRGVVWYKVRWKGREGWVSSRYTYIQ